MFASRRRRCRGEDVDSNSIHLGLVFQSQGGTNDNSLGRGRDAASPDELEGGGLRHGGNQQEEYMAGWSSSKSIHPHACCWYPEVR